MNTTLNPLALLDSLLEDYASPKARRAIHSVIVLLAVLVTIFLAAGGDWEAAVASLVAAIYAGANRANTSAVQVEDFDTDPDTSIDYREPLFEDDEATEDVSRNLSKPTYTDPRWDDRLS